MRAGQLGFSVACIEKWKTPKGEAALGGTCLNVGCIPSKALLESSEHFYQAKNKFQKHGIVVNDVKLDLDRESTVARWSEFATERLRGVLAAKTSGAVADAVGLRLSAIFFHEVLGYGWYYLRLLRPGI